MLQKNEQKRDTSILETYITSYPTPQNAIDIFKGEWSSELPKEHGDLSAGSVPLFNDPRIEWAIEQFGGVKGKRVIELGPLEAGHSYMLEKAGADSIISIEASTRAYLKCLIIKEILSLRKPSFLCGSFVEYLKQCDKKFDACVASGVFYHMVNPVELVSLIAKVTDQLYIWSHYYDADRINALNNFIHQFPENTPNEFKGFKYTQNKKIYTQDTLTTAGYCAGSEPYAVWLTKEDLLGALKHFGFTKIEIHFDKPEHPNGPNISLYAKKA